MVRSHNPVSRTSGLLAGLVLTAVLALGGWFIARQLGFYIAGFEQRSEMLDQAVPPRMNAPAVALGSEESSADLDPEVGPRNVIVVIADGIGFAHLAAARAAHHGIDGDAVWDRFEVFGWHRAHPADGLLTDSAASATAIATGELTRNGKVSVNAQGQPLTTLFEKAARLGWRTGIVTDSYIWDATPAAFAAHVGSRNNAEGILRQFSESQLDVLFGELKDAGEGGVPAWDETKRLLAKRFRVVGPDLMQVAQLTEIHDQEPIAAIFQEDQIGDLDSVPNLPLLTRVAVEQLQGTGDPYGLLIESEEGDSASHGNDFERLLRGLEALAETLSYLLDVTAQHGDTLLLFTSDHETGGLSLSTDRSNQTLRALWGTRDHTAVPVPLFASGPGAELFAGPQSNWEIGRALSSLVER